MLVKAIFLFLLLAFFLHYYHTLDGGTHKKSIFTVGLPFIKNFKMNKIKIKLHRVRGLLSR